MHLFHVVFTRYLGGLEQAFINDTEAQKARGHKVTALLRADAPYANEVAARADKVLMASPNGFYDVLVIWKIRKQLKAVKPDAIIAHNGRAIALMKYASWGLGIPLIGVSHSYKTARGFHADRLVVLSEDMRRHFADAGFAKPVTVIPNLMHLPPAPVFKKPRSPVVIGALGRLSEEKGFADLFHALFELKKTGLAFTVHLGGDGPEKEKLKTLEAEFGLAPYIDWKGWVQDKAAFYGGVDIMCLPSRVDSFPMVVLETLAYGKPLAATDAPGPVSMITHGLNGLLVPRRDASAMAAALYRLAVEPELAENMAKAAWAKAQDFGFEKVADEWDAMLAISSRC